MRSSKHFHFDDVDDTQGHQVKKLDLLIPEIVDPQYGMFVWPSAPVLAQYLFHNQRSIKGKHVLEIGAGTSLPGIVASKLGAKVTLSDSEYYQNCLENCRRSCEVNKVSYDVVDIIPITWGLVNEELLNLQKVDFIIGSDCFYDKKDFDDIMFTVAFLMEENPDAVFLTTYQLRSTKYSIDGLLKKWNLAWREIELESFCLYGDDHLECKHEIQMFEIRKDTTVG